ncbi:ABC transporter ATP-binding protein [Arthrobacter sp. NPDC080031]|uniref:ABC transporter ATP-binding protein n=1 Tax=Arthrobacter sp. NPDC080031 TaxID=3155918 RepID=UPI00344EFD1F
MRAVEQVDTEADPSIGEVKEATRLLEVSDLRTWFDTHQGTVHAVDGVDVTVERGKTLGIVGESGSGKSVLGRSIMNLISPKALKPSGTVHLNGTDIRSLARKDLRELWGPVVSMVFQDPMTSLNPVRRIGDLLVEGMKEHLSLDKAERLERAIGLLRRVGIPEPERRMRQFPHELSGGMRQRVGIAIALACRPQLLIADEPTTALDVTIQRQILDLLSELQEQNGMGMILITHNLGVAAGRTDDIAVMYAGRIIEQGPTRKVFAQTRHPYTQALLGSLPKLSEPPHTRLSAPPGRPPVVIDPPNQCRFAERCLRAQPECLTQDPPLVHDPGTGTSVACFFPVGTEVGERALAENRKRGTTPAGLNIERVMS